MKISHLSSLGIAIALAATTTSSHAYRAGSRTYEGDRGGSVTASGASAGRFSAGSVSATGPRGATYDAAAASNGRTTVGGRTATGVNGNTYSAAGVSSNGYRAGTVSATSYNGYRSGYVYTGGVYRPATVTVNSVYIAPMGACAGWGVIARPYYISYPVYATYPVEVSVQVELIRRKYYFGTVDGQVGPGTRQAISQYQAANHLQVTGSINKALVVSLGIAKG